MHALLDGKACSKCKKTKTLAEFNKDKNGKFGASYYCKPCAAANSRRWHKNRENDAEYKRKKRSDSIFHYHGITLEQYEEKLAAQNFECAICGVKLSASGHLTHLDHCHKTGKLRAFLCTNCNRALGHFQDDPQIIKNAIEYLNTHTR